MSSTTYTLFDDLPARCGCPIDPHKARCPSPAFQARSLSAACDADPRGHKYIVTDMGHVVGALPIQKGEKCSS